MITRGRVASLFSLTIIFLASAIWYWGAVTHQTIGPWPLLLVLVGFALKAGELRSAPDPFDTLSKTPLSRFVFPLWLLPLFALSALIGAGVAYDPVAGWGKFWVLLGGSFLYLILVLQDEFQDGVLVGFLGLVAGLVALNFLFTHDWTILPADIGLLNRLGLAWMASRPQLFLPALHPNFAGGILIMLLPFQVAGIAIRWWQSKFLVAYTVLQLFLLGLSLVALLLTSSRGAWLSLAAATGIYLLWLAAGGLATKIKRPRQTLFLVGLGLGSAAAIFLILIFPGGLISLVNRLPGLASGSSRWEIYQNTLRLIGDYPFTGGGLHSFPGLYSRYILNIPYFLFDYSHNLYLDILLEQGAPGFLAFMGLVLGSLTFALRGELQRTSPPSANLPHASLRWAALVSLVAVLFHGLMDNALHGGPGTPLLFVPVALALWATPTRAALVAGKTAHTRWGIGLVALFLFLSLGTWLFQPVRANWQANKGAIQLAQAELAGWPAREQTVDAEALQAATTRLQTAHSTYPDNLTANYRLGLLAAGEQTYAAAIPYLEAAYAVDPGHRGVIKSLGYSYVWSGRVDAATPLLIQIPEASSELETYHWWWGTQERPDLAEYAAAMGQLLANR